MAKATKKEETRGTETLNVETQTEPKINLPEIKEEQPIEPKQAEFDPIVEVEKLILEVVSTDFDKANQVFGTIQNRIEQFKNDRSKWVSVVSLIVRDIFKLVK